ncbi:MAG: phosphatidate cytidylyltransferase [Alphaproteobacteria bacterium]|nr:phosphatidate cytidylyltransferase [Alphaproteobacteria bacterium]
MAIGSTKELRRRAISALALGSLALGAVFAGPVPFGILVLLIAMVMSWEWRHIVRSGRLDESLFIHAAVVCLAVIATIVGYQAIAFGILLLGAVVLFLINAGQGAGISVLGVLYVGIPAVLLVMLRSADEQGLVAVLFIFCVVWASDISAFVGGRLIGGVKLYPSISPKKTWAGLLSAVAGAVLVGLAFWLLVPGTSVGYLLACAGGLGLIAQFGDLAESALKRLFRVKDSSDLIPGHGGFMDRLDGLVTAASAAVVLGLLINSDAPARALMFGM